ncbi:DUF559 domain-containing protein [Brevundimonas sp. NPDC092305]|uniref:DUF559 domain-containing protein n=1 Tax=Brevundimonas sp. NPDC092305 TaxID=3363957 RepID=UPI0037F9FC52
MDGEVHSTGDNPDHDARRTSWLADQGIEVMRIPARDVLQNADEVAEGIWSSVRSRLR